MNRGRLRDEARECSGSENRCTSVLGPQSSVNGLLLTGFAIAAIVRTTFAHGALCHVYVHDKSLTTGLHRDTLGEH
jgi:hypothetical protein